MQRVEATRSALEAIGADTGLRQWIQGFLEGAERLSDQIDRRRLPGEIIPAHEKRYSVFEPHTRWHTQGKMGRLVELGMPVCLLEDPFGFVGHQEVMGTENEVDLPLRMIERTQDKYPELSLCHFGKGFHSPKNRRLLDERLEHHVLPRKGRWSEADRERETEATF